MKSFKLRLLNFPGERLFKPRKRLAGISVPESIGKLLPFSEKEVAKIDENTDFILLIDYFAFDPNCNYAADFKEYLNDNRFFLFFNDVFSENSKELALVVKYLYSVKRVLQGLVLDDSIFSYHLPYLAEASFDLECSMLLIEEGYPKQSLQSLRNVMEVTLLHAYLSIKDLDYNDLLEKDDTRIPPFKEIVIFLRSEGLFKGDLERETFEIYRLLSEAVHSEVKKLNTGSVFPDAARFKEWYNFFIRVSLLHLRLIIRMVEIGI